MEVSVPAPPTEATKYEKCQKCRAGLDRLVIGGVGDWRHTIMCKECFHVERGLDRQRVIVPLVAKKYGISPKDAYEADERSQDEYERIILGGDVYDDLPKVTSTARWHARRLAVAS